MKPSEIIRETIYQFGDMLTDPNYVYDDIYMHRHIDGKVHCNFGGSLIRLALGKDYNCIPQSFFEQVPWAGFVVQMNLVSYGILRHLFPNTDDKTYKKVFKVDGFLVPRGTLIKDNMSTYLAMADYLAKGGF